jgi:hypothetical protein
MLFKRCFFLYIIIVSRTEAFPELYKKPPLNKLIAWRPVGSLLGHMILILGIQLFTFYYVKWQPWYVLLFFVINCTFSV